MAASPGPLPAGRPRAALLAAVRDGLAHLPDGARVVVACSAGPDSTALAFLTAEARPDLAITLVHVRHGLRDDAADAALAHQHAAWLGVEHVQRDVEVVPNGHGTEAAARHERYAALRAVAAEVGASAILVGHTADDQAETVLLRLARGTGTDGLAAMRPVSDDVTRPLLRIRRDDVRRFVALEGLPSVDDPSNRDPAVRRASVRHEVLPRLAEVGPDPVGALARLADLAHEDALALEGAAAPLRDQVRWVGDAAVVPARALRSTARSLAARVVREILTTLQGHAPSAAVVGRVLAPDGVSAESLPRGVDLTRNRGWVTLARRRVALAPAVRLPVTGTCEWSAAGRRIRVIGPDSGPGDEASDGQLPFELVGAWAPPKVRIDPAAVPPGAAAARLVLAVPDGLGDLHVRHREPGDRIVTRAGTQRIADVASDAGLPGPLRARWPVVVSGERVVWYPGLAVDRHVMEAGRGAPAALLVVEPMAGQPVGLGR